MSTLRHADADTLFLAATILQAGERVVREIGRLWRRLAATAEVEYVEESGDGDGLVGAPCRSVTH